MKKYNIIIIIAMYIIAFGTFYMTKDIPKISHGVMGASQWPRFIGVLMFIFTTMLTIQTIFTKTDSPPPINFKGEGIKKVLLLLCILVAFGAILPILGFLISSFIFIIASMVIVGDRSKPRILLSAVGITLFVYIFFEYLLNVLLPKPFFM